MHRRLAVSCLLLLLVVLVVPEANAGGLSRAERRAVLAGETVTRPMQFERRGGKYVGGVSYRVVPAPADALMRMLEDPEVLVEALPKTRRAVEVARRGRRFWIELTQGNAVVQATYTVEAVRDRRGREIRFWLDPNRPHGIRDVWGYFRVTPWKGQSLVTVAVALDVGPGPVRWLFEDRIQAIVLDAPRTIADYARAHPPRRPTRHTDTRRWLSK